MACPCRKVPWQSQDERIPPVQLRGNTHNDVLCVPRACPVASGDVPGSSRVPPARPCGSDRFVSFSDWDRFSPQLRHRLLLRAPRRVLGPASVWRPLGNTHRLHRKCGETPTTRGAQLASVRRSRSRPPRRRPEPCGARAPPLQADSPPPCPPARPTHRRSRSRHPRSPNAPALSRRPWVGLQPLRQPGQPGGGPYVRQPSESLRSSPADPVS